MTTLTLILPTVLFVAVFLSTGPKQAVAVSTGPTVALTDIPTDSSTSCVTAPDILGQVYFHRGSGRRERLPQRP